MKPHPITRYGARAFLALAKNGIRNAVRQLPIALLYAALGYPLPYRGDRPGLDILVYLGSVPHYFGTPNDLREASGEADGIFLDSLDRCSVH